MKQYNVTTRQWEEAAAASPTALGKKTYERVLGYIERAALGSTSIRLMTDGEIHVKFDESGQNGWMKVVGLGEDGLFTYDSGAKLSDCGVQDYCLARSRNN